MKNFDNCYVVVCMFDKEGERRVLLLVYIIYDGYLKCIGVLNVLNRCNFCLYDIVFMLGYFMLYVVVCMCSLVECLIE